MPRSSSAGGSLRAVTARGGALNAAFLSGAEALVLLQGLLATALLGPSQIGLYGIVTTTAMTIVALRRVGIDEAFVAQAAEDEEGEFQRAFGFGLNQIRQRRQSRPGQRDPLVLECGLCLRTRGRLITPHPFVERSECWFAHWLRPERVLRQTQFAGAAARRAGLQRRVP